MYFNLYIYIYIYIYIAKRKTNGNVPIHNTKAL